MAISNRERVFPFTNETLAAFKKVYDFTNAKILAPVASGDQYFCSILYGAKEVELYDINPNTYNHFLLKYYGIKTLSYEDFCTLFIDSRLNRMDIYEKFADYLPQETKDGLEHFISKQNGLGDLTFDNRVYRYASTFKKGTKIPYLNREQYYKLQSLLQNCTIPVIHLYNLTDLPKLLGKTHYDLILTSNICQWLNMSHEEYSNFLAQFDCPTVQADYLWHQKVPEGIIDENFSATKVPSFCDKIQSDKIITFKRK